MLKFLLLISFTFSLFNAIDPLGGPSPIIQQIMGDPTSELNEYIKFLGSQIFDKIEKKSKKIAEKGMINNLSPKNQMESKLSGSVFGDEDDSLKRSLKKIQIDNEIKPNAIKLL